MSDLEINDFDSIRRFMVVAKGGDPDAQQTLNEFLQFKNNIERTNLPKRIDVQRIVFLDYAGKLFYPDQLDNPFTLAADSIAVGFMAKGGDKSKQFVDLMRQTPNLADLQTTQDQTSSIMNRLMRRGKSE